MTEPRRMPEEMEHNRDFQRALLANLPGPVYHLLREPLPQVVFLSGNVHALTGYEAADFNDGLPWPELIHHGDRERYAAAQQAGLAAGEPFTLQYRIQTAAGEERHVEDRLAPVAGDPLGRWLGLLLDVTAAQRSAARLLLAQRRLDLLNRISRAINAGEPLETILKLTVRTLGETFPQVRAGYSEVLNGTHHRVLYCHQPPHMACLEGLTVDMSLSREYVKTLWRGEPVIACDVDEDERLQPLHADSGRDTVALADVPVLVDGMLAGLLFLNHAERYDWTDDEVDTLREVSSYVALAQKEVQARTERQRLVEEKEEQASGLARTNQELEQFAYAASHDLKEPLRTISAYSQLLSRKYQGRLDQEADQFLGFILDGTSRMNALITDLLTYSRAVGREPLQKEPTDLNEVLRWALMNVQSAVTESGAVVHVETLPTVPADGMRLTQVLQNLLSNALKYRRPAVSPEIHISAADNGKEWVISVRDNGLGIDPRFAEQIFGVFKRLHGREYPGTGVGLAICKRVVEYHGGRIWVESAGEGQGATFSFALPKSS